jgi:hypothetical protein
MPALTQKCKQRLADASEEEEESGDERVVGILAQRVVRHQAVREAERANQQVHRRNSQSFLYSSIILASSQ